MTTILFFIGKRIFEYYRDAKVDETCYLVIMIWLSIVLFAGYSVMALIARSRLGKVAAIVLLPGHVIRDLFKAIGCLATGTTITNFNLFRYAEPRLMHERSRMGVVGEFLVAAIPFTLMVFLIGAVAAGFEKPPIAWSAEPVHRLELSLQGAEDYAVHLVRVIFGTYRDVARADFSEGVTWVYLAALVVLSLAMTVEKEQLKYLVAGFAVYGFGLFFLHRLGLDFLQYGQWKSMQRFFLGEIGVVAAMLLLMLAIGGLACGLAYLLNLATGSPRPAKTAKGRQG